MNATTYRKQTSWATRLLIALVLILIGAAAAVWALARYQPAARFLGVTAAAAPVPTAYLRPSGWTEGKRHLTVVVGSGVSCLSSAGMRACLEALSVTHNAAVACAGYAS